MMAMLKLSIYSHSPRVRVRKIEKKVARKGGFAPPLGGDEKIDDSKPQKLITDPLITDYFSSHLPRYRFPHPRQRRAIIKNHLSICRVHPELLPQSVKIDGNRCRFHLLIKLVQDWNAGSLVADGDGVF